MSFLLLLACLSPLPTEVLTDADGDGFYADGPDQVDCDDNDPAVFPGAEEICDYTDNNCDGQVDELGLTLWYPDVDGDSYGVEAGGTEDCDPGDGWSPTPGDCQDSDAAINPDADEVCDGLDNDCDGSVDVDALDALSWYEDLDGDGYGDPATETLACEAPSDSATADNTDCDDAEALAFPGGQELCDGIDNDCDGEIDVGANDATPYYTDSDGDGYGAGEALMLCEAASGTVLDNSDCDDGSAQTYPGVATEQDSKDCMLDADGDGYGDLSPPEKVTPGTDCNDAEPSVNPGATEVELDGLDMDCDGFELCYEDADSDGYGTATLIQSSDLSCSSGGASTVDTDCDDTQAATNPGATELTADGVDNDCDTTELCYADSDGDSYGDTATVSSSDLVCTGSGEADNDDDCDDSDASISPAGTETIADGVDSDCDTTEICYLDSDGDSYGSTSSTSSADLDCSDSGESDNADDCNDGDPAINPDATEGTADGVDSDCDTLELCFVDGDGDSYGSTATVSSSDLVCTGSGEADNDDDCDDSSAAVSPAASEVTADGIDNDCDTQEQCFVDSDKDSYGSTSTTSSTDLDCSDSGEADNSDDCNDSNANISPDATERTADGVDNDCDTFELCYVDADGDSYGSTATVTSTDLDCTGSGEADNDEDCEDSVALAYPGATEVCDDGIDNDCDGLTTSCGPYGSYGESGGDAILSGSSNNYGLGTALATGDFDGDGTPDLWIGARYADENKTNNGSAYLLLGPVTSNLTVQSSDDASLKGNTKNGEFSRRLAVGDLNGDGNDDLIVHAYNGTLDSKRDDAGLVYVYYGPITSDINKADGKNKADAWARGDDDYDYFGYALAVGDLDDDGNEDLLVGSPYHYASGSYEGETYIFLGGVSGNDLSPDYTWDGGASDSYTGTSMISADFDGDGVDDWAVGGEAASSYNGVAYVVYGGISADGDWSSDADVTLTGSSGEGVGRTLTAGDFDGDGSTDLVVGAPYKSSSKGAAYVLTGTLSSGTVSSLADSTFTGAGNYDYASWSLDAGCDVDADGVDDLLIGAPEDNDGGFAYLVLGGWTSGSLSLSSDYDTVVAGGGDDEMGLEMLCVPDMDGNGADEFAVSAPWDGTDKGKVLMFLGGGD